MGTSSGVNAIALFSDLPYLLFQWPVPTRGKYGVRSGENFNFATENQRMFSTDTRVTSGLLFEEFTKLYRRVDRMAWRRHAAAGAAPKHGHPAAVVSSR